MRGIDQTKKWFFDSVAVKNMLDKKSKQALSKMGAFVRRRARSSIRKRKKVSDPGKPPTDRTGKVKRFIWFALDPKRLSLVVGPVKLGNTNKGSFRSVGGPGTRLLEHGGQATIHEVFHHGTWKRASVVRDTSGLESRERRVTIANRPFMGPALAAERGKFAQLFTG